MLRVFLKKAASCVEEHKVANSTKVENLADELMRTLLHSSDGPFQHQFVHFEPHSERSVLLQR